MRGRGYMSRSEWTKQVADLCQVSEKTAYRWLRPLIQFQLIKEKKGILYIKGKRALMAELNISSKNAISLEEDDLRDKTIFKKILVEQIGLLYQRRYRYAHKDIIRYSSNMKGRIENRDGIARKRCDVGCSLSYLSLKTGLSKSQVARSLGATRKVTQVVENLFLREFKAKYTNAYFKQHTYLSYSYRSGRYTIRETLASVLEADCKLKKSRL